MEYAQMSKNMLDLSQLKQINDLERDGLVDGNFRQCHSLKEESRATFLLDLINEFMINVHSVVSEMTKALNQPIVDFKVIYCQSIKIKGSCSCIGACRVRDECSRLCSAIENESKQGCLEALKNIKHQYDILAIRLDSFMRIEQEIVSRRT